MVCSSSGMEVLVRNKRDMRPLLLKLGVAVAFSFAGFLVSHLRSRLRSQNSIPGDGLKSGGEINNGGGLKDELRILKNDEALAKIVNGTTTTTTTTTTTVVELSPSRKSSRDEDGFLLPEFNEIMKEFEATGRDPENITPTSISVLKKFETEKHIAMDQEIEFLRNLVVSLSERERCLELQLLEYYGMEEQETAMRELESKLKINTMETKLYTMKIESLEADNRRLQALVSDYSSRVMSELESSRAKVKLLKRKLKSDGEQAKDKISAMQQIISKLQAKEANNQSNVESERRVKRLNELEDEVESLRMVNSRLLEENSVLTKKMEAAQMIASSVEVPKADLMEDVNQLREVNEKLMNNIDQLKTDRCADVEQLVYLRWVNACLRYELRNYQPLPGKAAARDLSKNLSPKSETKAKQLILEYAKSNGDEKNIALVDFDSEYSYPSSQVSTADSEDNSFDISSTTTTTTTTNSQGTKKSKFLVKLKKLMLGKNIHTTPPISHSNSERRMSVSSSTDDMIGRDSYDSFSSCMTEEHGTATELILTRSDEQGQSKGTSRTSMDMQEFGKQRLEVKELKGEQCRSHESGEVEQERRISFCRNSLLETEEKSFPEKAELKRFADVLRGSHKMSKIIRKRSGSFSHM
ncbi:Mitotic arrest deficient-like 1 Mad1 domain-containing protein [Dioscorea alata]|uniref:Mitotic arrest deficient-like 1 Mad1 domain-containing protein n=1 Tax=Dioscorea alata TaxID=55571 RepID=A0ACB7W3D5_DIOAL|nr:Mitotic arrest deficient-like 1 Mad1 domain-containing protein [Dioscorea alata]